MARRTTLALALAPVVLLATVITIVSCFNPKLGDGGFPCGPNNECPTGYTCATALGDCYKDGFDVPDGGIPDAMEGRVEVRVLDDNLGIREPAAARAVVFQGPDGKILSVVSTNAMGLAAYDQMVTGGMVTSGIAADGLSAGLETVIGVEPGDHIVMQGRFGGGGQQSPLVSTINVDIPAEFAGATAYQIDIGCGNTSGVVAAGIVTATLEARPECIHLDGGVQKINVVAHALSNTPAPMTPIAYTVRADVAVNLAGPTQVNMPTWTTDFLQLEARVVNPPVPVPATEVHRIEVRPQADQSSKEFNLYPQGTYDFPGGSNPPGFIWKFPRGVFDTLNLQVHAVLDNNLRTSQIYMANFVTPFPTQPVTVDLGMGGVGPTTAAMVNPGAADWGLTWSFADTPPNPPGGFLFLAGIWLEPGPGGVDAGGSDDNQRFWIVLAPAAQASPFTLPELPLELDGFRPSAQADFSVPITIAILGKVDIFDTYGEIRNEMGPGVIASDNLLPNRAFVLRASGLIPNN